ncbi:MAG TPA: GNAT family N-acetyltransferase [Trueperaceae bacterium]|nr:GNAT family N-acetyltransferase [Trueperaceae bacterium]
MTAEFRPLTADDMDQLIDLRSIAYGPVRDRDRAVAVLAARLPYSLGAFRAGRLGSVSFMLPLGAYLGGNKVTLGGLSGVATAPEARRGGLVAQSLRRWFAELHEQGVGWSAEHPFEPTFYERLGYQTVQNGHLLEIPLAELRSSAGSRFGSAVDAELIGPDDSESLPEIHARYARRFSFALSRDDGVKDHWGLTFKRSWESTAHFCYLMEDAYLVAIIEDPKVEPNRPTLSVRDVGYATTAGRERLFSLLGTFEGQVDKARMHLPPGDKVALDRAAYNTVQAAELQVRIVDLAAALGELAWPEPTSLTLGLTDPDCPWNDGVFAVDLGPDGATATPTHGAEPDAAMDIRALATLITGAATPETLIADGRAEGSVAKLGPLARALAGHPVFKSHNDHF